MTAAKLKREGKLREWSAKVAECRRSGMTVKVWCREQSISLSTYYYWERIVVARAVEEAKASVAEKAAVPESGVMKPAVTDLTAVRAGVPEFAELPNAGRITKRQAIMTLRTGQAEVDICEGASREMITAVCEALKGC